MSDIEKAGILEGLKARGQPNGNSEIVEATTAPLKHVPEAKRSDLEADLDHSSRNAFSV